MEDPKNVENLVGPNYANKEANIMAWSMGLRFNGNYPKKVDNPTDGQLKVAIENMGGAKDEDDLRVRIEFLRNFAAGLSDYGSGTIYGINTNSYVSEVEGIDWGVALEGVSPEMIHETGHFWVYDKMLKEQIDYLTADKGATYMDKPADPGEVERIVCFNVWNEGVAMYIQKRCNDYIKDTMVEACEKVHPNDPLRRQKVAEVFAGYYFGESNDPSVQEEDVFIMERTLKAISKKGVLGNSKKRQEEMALFVADYGYRLGYNIINRMVDLAMSEGKTESQALEDIVASPPMTVSKIKEILRI